MTEPTDGITIRRRIEELEIYYEGLRRASRVLKIDVGYLHRLKTGKKNNPGAVVLRKLGLKKVIIYQRRG